MPSAGIRRGHVGREHVRGECRDTRQERVRRRRVPMRCCRSQKPAKSTASVIPVMAGCHPARARCQRRIGREVHIQGGRSKVAGDAFQIDQWGEDHSTKSGADSPGHLAHGGVVRLHRYLGRERRYRTHLFHSFVGIFLVLLVLGLEADFHAEPVVTYLYAAITGSHAKAFVNTKSRPSCKLHYPRL